MQGLERSTFSRSGGGKCHERPLRHRRFQPCTAFSKLSYSTYEPQTRLIHSKVLADGYMK